MKSGSGEVGTLMREGRREEADALRARLAEARRALDALEEALRRTEAELDDVVLRIPNLPADDVPDGNSEADNVVVRMHGYDPADYAERKWLPHWEIAEAAGHLRQRAGRQAERAHVLRAARRWRPSAPRAGESGA